MSTNPWKLTTVLLAVALGASLLERLPEAEAAGPVRLGKALAALRSGKKFLEEAKDPPAPQHAQSMAAVNLAIGAVEREIKAYEATAAKTRASPSASAAKGKASPSLAPAAKPAPKKEEKPRAEKPPAGAEIGED
jgi:hypothetical protein